MPFQKLLIANRGEIAIRIARAAAETGLKTAAIYPADDAASLHVRTADESHEIPGRGARAYLDIEAVIAAAKAAGCDALHPGYGFLSENTALARRCAEEGDHLHRPVAGSAGIVRRQGQGQGAGQGVRRARDRGHRGASHAGGGKRLPRLARAPS